MEYGYFDFVIWDSVLGFKVVFRIFVGRGYFIFKRVMFCFRMGYCYLGVNEKFGVYGGMFDEIGVVVAGD